MRKLIWFLVIVCLLGAGGFAGYRGYKSWRQARLVKLAQSFLAKADHRNAMLCLQRALRNLAGSSVEPDFRGHPIWLRF